MLYKKFENNINILLDSLPFSKIAIAVSGGSDSMALFHLMSIWAKNNNIEIISIYVDHNLRLESKLENEYIKEFSNKLKIKHYSLSLELLNNFSNLQERAREGRYELMTKLCQKLDILVLLTAHHADDFVENFCLRLERKSSNFGLSSSRINWYNNIKIVRPLFNISKSELIYYLIKNNIQWFEDISNSSDKYKRNVVRKKLAKEEKYNKPDIVKRQLAIDSLLENKLRPELIKAIAEAVKFYEYGFAYLNLSKFSTFSDEVKSQLINYLLIIISGKKHTARYYSVRPLLNLIINKKEFKNTLHGCIIKSIKDNLLVYKELGKKLPEARTLSTDHVVWDNRFYIKNNDRQDVEVYNITHLTLEDYINIKNKLDMQQLKNLTLCEHISILFTLPVIKILEKIIAIPHISYYNNERKNFEIAFISNFTSRFTHFC